MAPLAAWHGASPPAPHWFQEAIAAEPAPEFVKVDGADIETLSWGERGRPGILLMHGNRAHAHWWSPLAPLLANGFRVTAFSFSGMGGSEWRQRYSIAGFAQEALTVAEATGLFDAGPPMIVAHSFGSRVALSVAESFGRHLRGVVICDPLVTPDYANARPPPVRNRGYPTLAAALARFRLAPPQPCEHLFYVDWIARRALRPSRPDEFNSKELKHAGSRLDWRWRFDPTLWDRMEQSDSWRALQQTNCPLAVIRGTVSVVADDTRWAAMQKQAPLPTVFHEVADAAHHLMLDQPLAFVELIRSIRDRWFKSLV